ncbi:Aspartyl/asparaginyl beta-hydroxylase [Lamellibrachia satsuma]|nr:Aspartyl/asparaginyl beta-hydroxylase [Lamellibrachia satsuma]
MMKTVPSDNVEQMEDEAQPSVDNIEQMEEVEPPSDDSEQMEDETQPPSDDIEQTEDEAQPPSDDIEQTEDEAQPPSDDIKQTEDEAEPSNDDIEQTEHEAVPPGDKDRYKTPGDKAEHTPDTTGAKEQESMKTQVKQETEDAADVTADSSDEEDQSGHHQVRYHNAHITNQEDFEIREKLDAADRLLQQKQVQEGRVIFEQLLSLHPQSPRATYGRALALDIEADLYRSNALLEQAITEYLRVLELPDVPKALMILSGRKCSTRQTFRGWVNRAVTTMKKIVTLFPEELDLWSELGVQYLIRGSNSEAREAFLQVLQRRPDDGFAKVHLGFIIKVVDRDYDKSIPYLQQGIDSGVPGTIDGRFFVHLGDALYRVGRHNEAQKVYDLGYKKGVFMSPLQRSLHNVERLTAHPWWTAEETGVKERLKLLEENWEVIRDEGLAQLNDTTGAFELEAEDLRDKGEWRQFTLYRQGHKVLKNCRRTPKTCELLDQFPEATSCKRGQIKYSVMHPGIHVWPHCGPTNCRIRAHLGLVVPPGLRIRVVNETRSWTEGRFIVFDDSFDHEVWHEGNSLRLVLIVDIWHPELTTRERTTLPPI